MRWAIAGHGDIVARRALPALRQLGETVVGVVGRDAARARAFAARTGIDAATSTLDDLLHRVDAVYVATPVASHVPLAMAAVAAGRHVLVEKPVAGALDEPPITAALVELAGQRSVTVGVAYYRRLAPAMIRLRTALHEGRGPVTGPVTLVRFHLRTPFEPEPTDPKYWRTVPALAGGGVLADAGSHRLDLLCWLFGAPDTVSATLGRHHPGGAERQAALRLTWPSGTVAHLVARWQAEAVKVDRLTLCGGGWRVVVDPLDSGRLRWDLSRRHRVVESAAPPANPHVPLFADFRRAARTGTDPVCPLGDALLVDRLLVAAGHSSRRGGLPWTP